MNVKAICRIQSWILAVEAAFMLPALTISLAGADMPAVNGFIGGIIVALIAATILYLYSRNSERRLYAREGLVCTGIAWIALSLVGCLPFLFSGRIPNFFDAFFEIVSGFTTTGASILPDVEAMGKGLLYWRSFSHWVGGMGILVFLLAIIPAGGNNDGYMLHILRAESPGPSVNKMVPRMRDTAAILYGMYCVLTVLDILFLLLGKMPVFDAFCIAFGTAGTGGFGVLNSSLAEYTPFAQNVTTIFMLLFGINFGAYYLLLMRHFGAFFKDEEIRTYLIIVACSIVVICICVFKNTPETGSLGTTLRHSAFQVASIITTTGYSTVDFDLWASLPKGILLTLMFVGACAGSTGGGIKVSRVVILFKNIRRNAHQIFHPHEVRIIRVNNARVPERTVSNVDGYLAVYVVIIIVSFLVLSADKINASVGTNFSAVMATFNNIGPGFEGVGPTRNYSMYSNLSKLVLSMDMLLGRLEIFPILAIFAPSTHRKFR